jgi:antitoxin component YwqK of YwqJK toxin-antitoxin module
MKNTIKALAIALAAVIGFSMAACDNGTDPGSAPSIAGTYFFESDSDTYVLTISEDGTYELTVVGGKTSTGTAEKKGGVYTLTPSSSSEEAAPFTVTVNSSGVTTGINGIITFDDGTTQEAPAEVTVTPTENVPEKYRWWAWRDSSSTATLDYFSVDDDDTVTITTGGRPEPQGVNNVWQAWKITAEYAYTSKANTSYKYVIEASKQGAGDRRMNVQYYEDTVANIYLGESFTLTNTPTQYTVYGQKLPKRGEPVRFQCADYTGTFYLKIISIEEYEPGELTITNFRGKPSLRSDKWTMGDAQFFVNDEWVSIVFVQHDDGFDVPATGSSITVNVYNAVFVDYEGYEKTTPFTGSGTVEIGNLSINQWGDNYGAFYVNKVPINFTKGKATINFGTQMVNAEDAPPGGGEVGPVGPPSGGGGPGGGGEGTGPVSFEVVDTSHSYNANGDLTGYSDWEYDSKGNNTKSSSYYANGVLASYTEYDSNGKLTKQSGYYASGVLLYNGEFDSKGNRTRQNSYDTDGELSGYGDWEYDSNGNMTKLSTYYASGELILRTEYERDSNGNMTKSRTYRANGELYEYSEYEYDSKGNTTKGRTYNANDVLTGYSEYEYEYDSKGNVTKSSNYVLNGGNRELYQYTELEYDSKGRQTKVSTYKANGEWQYTEREYNSNGNQTKVSTYVNGELTGYTISSYKTITL